MVPWQRRRDLAERERSFPQVWTMKSEARLEAYEDWKADILKGRFTAMRETGLNYNGLVEQMRAISNLKDRHVIQPKRMIGCTTTAAAKYVDLMKSVKPDILLVEEAGEILESHILTALGPEIKQVVLIGDHKQLRPRVRWELSVEKGKGYDLNRSLFERLVLKDYPHQVLSQQHRMRPEISALARALTYPDLKDAALTSNRQDLMGFQDDLILSIIMSSRTSSSLYQNRSTRCREATHSKPAWCSSASVFLPGKATRPITSSY